MTTWNGGHFLIYNIFLFIYKQSVAVPYLKQSYHRVTGLIWVTECEISSRQWNPGAAFLQISLLLNY